MDKKKEKKEEKEEKKIKSMLTHNVRYFEKIEPRVIKYVIAEKDMSIDEYTDIFYNYCKNNLIILNKNVSILDDTLGFYAVHTPETVFWNKINKIKLLGHIENFFRNKITTLDKKRISFKKSMGEKILSKLINEKVKVNKIEED